MVRNTQARAFVLKWAWLIVLLWSLAIDSSFSPKKGWHNDFNSESVFSLRIARMQQRRALGQKSPRQRTQGGSDLADCGPQVSGGATVLDEVELVGSPVLDWLIHWFMDPQGFCWGSKIWWCCFSLSVLMLLPSFESLIFFDTFMFS